jgi:hypothetical protein
MRWVAADAMESPIVLPAPAAADVFARLGAVDLSYIVVEYGPPGRPRRREHAPTKGSVGVFIPLKGLPPGPFEISVFGSTKRVDLREGKPASVHFFVGR